MDADQRIRYKKIFDLALKFIVCWKNCPDLRFCTFSAGRSRNPARRMVRDFCGEPGGGQPVPEGGSQRPGGETGPVQVI